MLSFFLLTIVFFADVIAGLNVVCDMKFAREPTGETCILRRVEAKPEDRLVFVNPTRFTSVLEARNSSIAAFPNDLFSQIPSLSEVSMRNVSLLQIPRDSFQTAHSLEMLDLSLNRLETVRNKTFEGAEGLQVLLLESSQISVVEVAAFSGLGALKELFLSFNPITSLETGTFSPLRDLMKLELRGCDLNSLDSGLFLTNNNLLKLNLQENQLTRLQLDLQMPTFDSLDFSQNRLVHLELRYASKQTKRDYLGHRAIIARNNYLQSVSIDSRLRPKSVDLASNLLSDVRNLTGLTSLLTLGLAVNPLSPVTFENLTALQSLDLEQTHLKMDRTVFKGLTQLSFLSLATNDLKEISPEWFQDLRSLRFLDLRNNRLGYFAASELKLPLVQVRKSVASSGPGSDSRGTEIVLDTLDDLRSDIRLILVLGAFILTAVLGYLLKDPFVKFFRSRAQRRGTEPSYNDFQAENIL